MRLEQRSLRIVLAFSLLLIVSSTSFAQMKPGDRRKAYGEARASVIESVLTTLYPGAEVQWDPQLMVLIPGQKPHSVEVPVFLKGSVSHGGIEGVASVELDGIKKRFIFDAKDFHRTDQVAFPTLLVVFRADASGHIERYKKFKLDPGEPLTELKTMSIEDWSKDDWPTLQIQYDTHVVGPRSFTTIEWQSTYDVNSGKLLSRLPFGMTRIARGRPKQDFIFRIGRTGTNTLVIGDRLGGETHEYDCSEPCVIDRQILFSQWIH
jgi:hypothetical protein